MVLGLILYAAKDTLGMNLEPMVVFFGAAFIVLAHVLNINFVHQQQHQNESCSSIFCNA